MAAPHAESEAEVLERHEGKAGAGPLSLRIVSPTGAVATAAAAEVTAPGLLGEFGVLPGHIPFLSALKAGVLSWKTVGGREGHMIAIDRGYLEVGAGDGVVVMIERHAKADQVDVEAARAAAAEQSEALKTGGLDSAGLELARLELGWAQARLELVDRASGKAGAGKH